MQGLSTIYHLLLLQITFDMSSLGFSLRRKSVEELINPPNYPFSLFYLILMLLLVCGWL